MAVDQTQKAKNLASETVTAVDAFMAALEKLESLEAERANGGLTLTDFDADFAGLSTLQHVDGTKLNAVLNTSIPAIRTFIDTNNHDDNLAAARSGKR